MISRRQVVLGIGAGALAPLAFAQQPAKVHRIGFLGALSAADSEWRVEAVRAGLRDLGYLEGKNIAIEYRWAEGRYERLPELAAELVRLKVDVLVTHATPGSLAAKQATATIPIVIAAVADPIASGIVARLARSGGNITGSTYFNSELMAKRLEFLKEAFPRTKQVAVLLYPESPANGPVLKAMETAARSLKMELQQYEVRDADRFESAFTAMVKKHIGAVVIFEDPIFFANATAIADLVVKKRLPAAGFKEFAEAGGLLGYGVNIPEMYRRAAYFVDKILKGAKPGDLPIEQATKFELVINLKTAKALGITIPQSLLFRADRVIE